MSLEIVLQDTMTVCAIVLFVSITSAVVFAVACLIGLALRDMKR